MRRFIVTIVIALPLAAVAACLSFGDLQGSGDDAGVDAALNDALLDSSSIIDTSTIDAAIVDTGPIDQGDAGILSCNAPGLVAYFPMNERAGSLTQDCHLGLDGTLTSYGEGGVTWGTRADGGSLEFTGDGYVMLGVRPQFQVPGAFTVSAWVRTDKNPANYISLFYNYATPTLTGVELALSPGGIAYAQIAFGTTAAEAVGPVVPLDTWVHYATVYTPGVGLELYKNGSSIAATTMTEDGGPIPDSGFAPNTGRQSLLGADFYNSYWIGGIDEVRLFSRALSDTEINALAAEK